MQLRQRAPGAAHRIEGAPAQTLELARRSLQPLPHDLLGFL
jgi:hypothetical protein